jgi:hypothetical protein
MNNHKVSHGKAEPVSPPDPEVSAQATRRRFTADYKQRIRAEADRAKGSPGPFLDTMRA